MRAVLWVATMLFFVAFFTYGYFLWARSRRRRESAAVDRKDNSAEGR